MLRSCILEGYYYICIKFNCLGRVLVSYHMIMCPQKFATYALFLTWRLRVDRIRESMQLWPGLFR